MRRTQHVWAGGIALLLLVGGIAVQSTSAAFSASTGNTGNSWSSGDVALSDDDAGTAMFSVSNMAPTQVSTRCIAVSYSGSLNANVRLYGAISGGTGLEDYLDLTVERGSGGSFASCAGFVSAETVYTGTLAGFTAAHTSYATGAGTWAPTGGAPVDAMTYRVVVTLQDDDAAQGLASTASFTWAAQNV